MPHTDDTAKILFCTCKGEMLDLDTALIELKSTLALRHSKRPFVQISDLDDNNKL